MRGSQSGPIRVGSDKVQFYYRKPRVNGSPFNGSAPTGAPFFLAYSCGCEGKGEGKQASICFFGSFCLLSDRLENTKAATEVFL